LRIGEEDRGAGGACRRSRAESPEEVLDGDRLEAELTVHCGLALLHASRQVRVVEVVHLVAAAALRADAGDEFRHAEVLERLIDLSQRVANDGEMLADVLTSHG